MQAEIELNAGEDRTEDRAVTAPRVLKPRAPWIFKQILQSVVVVIVALTSYTIISRFILQSVEVVGVSMQPTLKNSDHYFLNRWIYHVRSPRRGDVVVIKDPVDKGLSVKRVIALGGETVVVRNGVVVVNGSPLDEPYLASAKCTYPDGSRNEQTLACRQNEFVVMGDNRMNSADSRSYGPIPRENILGLIIH